MMDYIQLVMPVAIFFLTIITGGIGWFARQLYDITKHTARSLDDHKLEVAKNYVPNERLEKMFERFDSRLTDIHVLVAQRVTQK